MKKKRRVKVDTNMTVLDQSAHVVIVRMFVESIKRYFIITFH